MQITTTPNPASPVGNNTNFNIIQGETVNVGPNPITQNGSILNLTSYTAQMVINFPTPLILNTSNSGITIPTPANGQFYIKIASSVTGVMPPGAWAYNMSYTDASGNETALLAGLFAVQQAVI